jgi:hypothetical protein
LRAASATPYSKISRSIACFCSGVIGTSGSPAIM